MTVRDNPEQSRYEITVDGQLAGFVVYRDGGDTLTMVHTEVDPEWEGQGVGSALVKEALDDVRARGLEIRPTCPFVAEYVKRHPEYGDLVSSAS
ncbi:MAG TPA: GNAT family N-acetyltransferase [Gaiellaceae bacterium]